jgi:hypothetical protein
VTGDREASVGAQAPLDAARALGQITGRPAIAGPPQEHLLRDLATRLEDGYAVTARSQSDSELWAGDERLDGGRLVSAHEYAVKAVDLSALPPTITAVNPWGPRGAAPHLVILTEAEWLRFFATVAMVRLRD